MKRLTVLCLAAILLLSFMTAAEAATFKLNRFILCHKVEGLEPVLPSDSFSRETKKVYAFIEAVDVEEDTTISIQWLFEGKETALIDLQLKKGQRWRTFSSKRIGIRFGKWEVRMLDNKGRLVEAQTFTVK